MALGKQIQKHRKDKGWTLEQLSEASGVAVGTIGALEVRDSERSKYAAQLAKALGMTVEQLSGEAPNPAPQATGDVFNVMTAEESELLYNYRALTDEDRATFYANIAESASKTRAHVAKVLKAYGLKPHENGHHSE